MTEAHYEQFVALYEKYHAQGFEILAFPSNEFGRQEPKSNEEIQKFVAERGVKFPVFAKTTVNGKHAHPVFTFLRAKLSGLLGAYIKWNFTKFLCNRDGIPIKRYAPTTKPNECEADIVALLNTPATANAAATAADPTTTTAGTGAASSSRAKHEEDKEEVEHEAKPKKKKKKTPRGEDAAAPSSEVSAAPSSDASVAPSNDAASPSETTKPADELHEAPSRPAAAPASDAPTDKTAPAPASDEHDDGKAAVDHVYPKDEPGVEEEKHERPESHSEHGEEEEEEKKKKKVPHKTKKDVDHGSKPNPTSATHHDKEVSAETAPVEAADEEMV